MQTFELQKMDFDLNQFLSILSQVRLSWQLRMSPSGQKQLFLENFGPKLPKTIKHNQEP